MHWVLLGFGIGMALWAKYFVVVQAVPLVLFGLFDRDARKSLATPGPWLAIAVALVVMAPHLVWLVQNDFLPFTYADARAVQFKGGHRLSDQAVPDSCCRSSAFCCRRC